MSYPGPPDQNPYASPVAPPVAPPVTMPITAGGPRQDSMDYMRAYNYVFENPNWLTNLLLLALCSVCLMIPVLGIVVQLVVLGYQFETVDLLLKSHGRQYPDFDFGRIGDYLTRGLWPFLVSLIATFVLLPVVYIGMGVVALAVAGIASAGGDTLGPILGFGLGAVAVVLLVVVIVLVAMLMIAMILRSGLAQDFVAAFQFDWLKDFVSKMWLDMILAGLFVGVTGFVMEMIGILALCVGLFFAIALILMAYSHILYQLYVVYLSRGGTPVMVKVATPHPYGPPKV